MRGPLGAALTAAVASLLGAGLLVPASATGTAEAASAPEAADTTPPRVQLDPCPEVPLGEACSRREAVWVEQMTVDPAEGLAVAGVRIGDTVLSEQVYDDGTGFTPYGLWLPPYNDVVSDYDYVSEAWLDEPGLHELTFYARDLAGNEASVTRTVIGPDLPSRPRAFTARVRQPQSDLLWSAHGRGSAIYEYVVRFKGEEPFRVGMGSFIAHPGLDRTSLSIPLDPGRHKVFIRAVSLVGEGPTRSFVFRVPRR